MKDKIRLAGVIKESIVDGPGIRFVIFCQGCSHHCPGCHNQETHDPMGGREYDLDTILNALTANPMIQGVTFSGGEPFEQAEGMAALAERILEKGYGIWAYSGYTFEQILNRGTTDPAVMELLKRCSVLIDGPFMEEEKTLNLPFRGSANQRILDVPKSLEAGQPVELKRD